MLNSRSTLLMKKKSKNTITFLDTLIITSQNVLDLKALLKPTNKNDYIHFYTDCNNKIKTGLKIVFFLIFEHLEYVSHNTLKKLSLKRPKYLKILQIKY